LNSKTARVAAIGKVDWAGFETETSRCQSEHYYQIEFNQWNQE
jgi:hypothetical protein